MKGTHQKTVREFLPKLNRCIKANLNNEQFGVGQLAAEMGMSRSNLYRKLQKATGKNISRYIREFRLDEAKRLLRESDRNTSEVAHEVGFGSVSYFSKCFSEYFGYSPSKIRFGQKDGLGKPTKEVQKIRSKFLFREGIVMTFKGAFMFFSSKTRSKPLPSVSLNRKTVIVLPFKNLNIDEDNQYLTISLVHAISRCLSNIDDLDVIHTEAKDTLTSLREMGEKLNVTYALQGSLQKAKNTYRVEVRLIDTQTGKHMWCHKYDKQTSDILKLQTEIARHIAQTLKLNLIPKGQMPINGFD